MSSNPRSVVIGHWHPTTDGAVTIFQTCPANITLIVKSIVISNLSASASFAQVLIDTGSGTGATYLVNNQIAAGTTFQWNGTAVLIPPYRLLGYSQLANSTFHISGTVLQGVGVIPPAATTLPGEPPAQPITSS